MRCTVQTPDGTHDFRPRSPQHLSAEVIALAKPYAPTRVPIPSLRYGFAMRWARDEGHSAFNVYVPTATGSVGFVVTLKR